MMITPEQLVAQAKEAMLRAYTPYSDCFVGAALLGKSGKVYMGCNIENASFSPTICAERTAFSKAVSEGEKEFVAIAIVGGKHGEVKDVFAPCGVCRQVMAEFCDPDTFLLYLVHENGYDTHTLGELLPCGFYPKSVKGE